jgi:choline-sulfatase
MKIIMIDIDTLRPDHLSCYGYHRNTSPNIDRVCGDGIRFDNVYVPDAPCLPSRSALHHGRFGIHNGAINHGGAYADPYKEGAGRSFHNTDPYKNFIHVLRDNGFKTTTVSSFAGRHDAWWFLAGFNEVYDCGKGGMEKADEVLSEAMYYIEKNKEEENWFFHFNIWDPHTPYRTPEDFGNPFEEDPPADWFTQELLDEHRKTFGTHSAVFPLHIPSKNKPTDREVDEIRNLTDYKKWVDGYDCGIAYSDWAVGKILSKLEELGLYEDCAVIITSDHGENQGELNVYGDHQTADAVTCRVPMILKWPGIKNGIRKGYYYQFDITATILEMLNIDIPGKWDALPFKEDIMTDKETGRPYLVVSQAAWSCQRAVVFQDHILIKTYDSGLKDFPEIMLFDLQNDPHETVNLADINPELVEKGLSLLQRWHDTEIMKSDHKEDPMMKVLEEGGPFHAKGRFDEYLEAYKRKGRDDILERLKSYYGVE